MELPVVLVAEDDNEVVHSGRTIGDPIAAVSSLVILADMLLFGRLVHRREPIELAWSAAAAPAE